MRMSFLIPALAILAIPVAASAQQPDLVCALDPSCTNPVPSPSVIIGGEKEGQHFRGISKTSGTAAPQPKNSVNMAVNFEYNSAILKTDALITLDQLGTSLANPKLANYKFRIAGHTDARGSDTYNQVLSERRAKAVRDYLVAHFGIAASRLTAVGYGSKQLLFPEDKDNAANRRVQIVNATVNPAE
jgi:outer membrane protein OmpA-like peptidoglycan-associated protein